MENKPKEEEVKDILNLQIKFKQEEKKEEEKDLLKNILSSKLKEEDLARSKNEDLHKDLLNFVSFNELLNIKELRHPLLYSIPYEPNLNHRYNEIYLNKRLKADQSLRKGDFHSLLLMYEKGIRCDVLLELQNRLSGDIYWPLLRNIWIRTEMPSYNIWVWTRLFFANKKYQELFMSEEDREVYRSLPEKVHIYRGYLHPRFAKGISYTLDREVASFFTKRFKMKDRSLASVSHKVVNKEDIFAYTNERGEKEIIYLMDHI